ncbi:MAG: TIGR02266 family protein [Deltaproteobacteria bacterium]|nr:TIGR02266 family protein [Deltaproteobacteria bacterium]
MIAQEPTQDAKKMESGPGKDNRRQYPRKPLKVEINMESESNFFKGFSENISEGGLFVVTHDIRPIGSEVDLEFSLPGNKKKPVYVRAQVRWLREYDTFKPEVDPGMGLKFLDLDPGAREDIERFTAKREPLFYDD